MDRTEYLILDKNEHEKKYRRDMGEISPFDAGIPLLDISEPNIQEIYYYRQHTFCRHIRRSPEGYIVTEFYPNVPWAGKYNTISCPAGHHMYEGRWLHDRRYIDDYMRFWFSEGAEPRRYSFWAADAVLSVCKVTGDLTTAKELYEPLKLNYSELEKKHGTDSGLFYQIDDRDGMEYSAGGSGYRPTINSYMFGDARALSEIAALLGKDDEARLYAEKAENIRKKVNECLWDDNAEFYKTRAENKNYGLADVRELIGYVPWYFDLPDDDKSVAWRFLNDEKHFGAPFGPTTAERCCPDFMKEYDHECLWNGPSWPFATSQTLTALANLLANHEQSIMTRSDYFALLAKYSMEQHLTENGVTVPFIDEDLDPFTGEWIARKLLREMKNPPGGADRGEHYNHSTFCDLVISGLVGIRPTTDDLLTVKPMFAHGDLDYLCADGILYHGRTICVMWDKNGERYGRGAGFRIYVDGSEMFSSPLPCDISVKL